MNFSILDDSNPAIANQEAGRNINELPGTVKDLIQDRAGQSDVVY